MGLNKQEPIESFGEWWDPREPDKRWAGTLRIDREGARLTVADGADGFNHDHREYPVILGEEVGGKFFSLLHCFDTETSFGSFRLARREIQVHEVLDGMHADGADPLIHSAEATIQNVAAWSGLSAIQLVRGDDFPRKATIVCERSDVVTLWEADGIRLEVKAVISSLPLAPDDSGLFNLREEVRLVLTAPQRQRLHTMVKTLHACRDLLSVASQDFCDIIKLTVAKDDSGEDWAILRTQPIFRGKKPVSGHQMLFRLSDLSQPQVNFAAWLQNAEGLAALRSLYFSSQYGSAFIELRFLALCQAIEGFHFRNRDGLHTSKSEFRSLAQLLEEAIPRDTAPPLRESLTNSIRGANRYSLRRRLELLLDEHREAVLSCVPQASELLPEIVRQRNFIAHDPMAAEASGRASGKAMQGYIFLLKLLLEACFLSSMGMAKDEIAKLTKRSNRHQAWGRHWFSTERDS